MRNSVIKLLGEAQSKMSAYAALLNYRLANLCVKAAPEALLPIQVEVDGDSKPLEKVAQVCNAEGREDQFELYPMNPDLLFPLIKGINSVHPEFKIELKFAEGSEDEEDRYVVATMPEVDDVRHDLLTDAVKVLSDGCNTQQDITFSRYSAQLVTMLAGAKAEEIDEAKDALQQLHDTATGLCKQFRATKEQEIEDAYAVYQAKKAEKKQNDAASNAGNGMQMNWEMTKDE